MQMTPQITFEGSDSSDAARSQIIGEIERLEVHNKRITGCRVKVIAPHNHRHGIGFEVHIWLTLPPHRNIIADRAPANDRRHDHAEAAIKDAFASVRRQVDDLAGS
jgi:ribosome-associated translation inhibitor RaiA